MRKGQYERYYSLEDDYWWFLGMRDIFYRSISRIYKGREDMRILDAGCGTGGMIKDLQRFGECTGIDIEPKALEFCRSRGAARLVCAKGSELPFKDGTFDLITLFSVVEHIDDDAGFLKEVHRVCKDNGRIVLSTSAFKFLWSAHDVVSRHKRRYTKRELKTLIGKYFTIEKITYTNCLLFPFIWAGILMNNLFKGRSDDSSDGFYAVPGVINKALLFILRLEAVLLQKFDLPFGVSLLCIARR